MSAYEISTLVISVAQLGIVWYGIAAMVSANRDRTQTGVRQEQEDQRRHAETMTALEQQGQALAALVKGMETMIERTAPKPTS